MSGEDTLTGSASLGSAEPIGFNLMADAAGVVKQATNAWLRQRFIEAFIDLAAIISAHECNGFIIIDCVSARFHWELKTADAGAVFDEMCRLKNKA